MHDCDPFPNRLIEVTEFDAAGQPGPTERHYIFLKLEGHTPGESCGFLPRTIIGPSPFAVARYELTTPNPPSAEANLELSNSCFLGNSALVRVDAEGKQIGETIPCAVLAHGEISTGSTPIGPTKLAIIRDLSTFESDTNSDPRTIEAVEKMLEAKASCR